MTKLNEGERLVKLETDVTYIKDTVNEAKSTLKDMNAKLDVLLPTLVTGTILNDKLSEIRKEFKQGKSARLKDLIIQALVIGPISALIGFFFATVTKVK